MTKIAIAAVLYFASLAAQAQWTVRQDKDAMTDEASAAAVVRSQAGHVLQLYRVKDSSVWATFIVSETSSNLIAHDAPIMLRIDSQPHQAFQETPASLRKVGTPSAWQWKPKFVNFKVWHGDDSQGRARVIADLLSGQQLLVRYRISTGGYDDIRFTLAGAKEAIPAALQIPVEPSAENLAAAELSKSRSRQLDAALNDCSALDPRAAALCIGGVRACMAASNDLAERGACYAEAVAKGRK